MTMVSKNKEKIHIVVLTVTERNPMRYMVKLLIVIKPRLTEVERGQAISQLIQGHTCNFVRMFAPYKVVIRLRITGRVPGPGTHVTISRIEGQAIEQGHT